MNATAFDLPPPRLAVRRPDVAEFDGFYQSQYPNIVAMVFALVGDLAEAQDLAQESFCRAWRRWDSIASYDNPAAWVRRVASNLVSSRWRHLRVVRGHLRRERVADLPGLEPDHVALVAALRLLPADQRHALVLHYVVDLPLGEVARELGAPVGTVKSWLHRGRGALAAQLGGALEEGNGHD